VEGGEEKGSLQKFLLRRGEMDTGITKDMRRERKAGRVKPQEGRLVRLENNRELGVANGKDDAHQIGKE